MRCLSSKALKRAAGMIFAGSARAPEDSHLHDETNGAFGYVHSYETASRCDGPGLRFVLFVSGCPLRCSYCHNPDSWHLKDGTPSRRASDRSPGGLCIRARRVDGGLTISGGTLWSRSPLPGHLLPPRRWAFTPRLRPRAISAIAWTTNSVEPRPRPARHQEFRPGHLST